MDQRNNKVNTFHKICPLHEQCNCQNRIEMSVCWHLNVYIYKHECAHYDNSKKSSHQLR